MFLSSISSYGDQMLGDRTMRLNIKFSSLLVSFWFFFSAAGSRK